MNDGDVAGLGLLAEHYGFVGVKKEDGATSIVMVNAGEGEVARVPLDQAVVYLRADADFQNQTDRAGFSYSLDGETWTRIGDTLQMRYTLGHFMGYRFALFTYATETPGGSVDFDYFR
jgi:beta-xylosidase